jgi:Xaa-Pro aminopeptidase
MKHSIFIERRKALADLFKKHNPAKKGVMVLFGSFEESRIPFRQDSTFYYFTGVKEPAAVCVIDLDGNTQLLLPHLPERAEWVSDALPTNQETATKLGFSSIKHLGEAFKGYSFSPFYDAKAFNTLLEIMRKQIAAGGAIATTYSSSPREQVEQKFFINRMAQEIPELKQNIIDITPAIIALRQKKAREEIELMYKAVDITMVAQQAAAMAIDIDKSEFEIAAAVEYVIREAGHRLAFPSIVATGHRSTILHAEPSSTRIKREDMVVVDIGAEVDYYCADLTRTYPASGSFSKRQRQVYDVVLKTQEYIADKAKPGMWINNKEHAEKSLHHLALSFLEKQGYGSYFSHGIGHYLGLDVHDVGNYQEPLQEGDVITIEPGIYIPSEKLGIRIEDNYWILKDGAMCLSEALPKQVDEIEDLMHQEFGDESSDEE